MKDRNDRSATRRPEIITTATRAEVENAISTKKKDKAPGFDGIINEFLIENKDTFAPILVHIFNEIFQ